VPSHCVVDVYKKVRLVENVGYVSGGGGHVFDIYRLESLTVL
jgi:hypothetical protein